MHRASTFIPALVVAITAVTCRVLPAQDDKDVLAPYRQAAMAGGDVTRGRGVFESKEAACKKCHAIKGSERLAGPDLGVIGDKYGRDQLVRSVLEPSAMLHPDYGTVVVNTSDGKVHTGVLRKRDDRELQLYNADGKLMTIPLGEIDEEKKLRTSLMPSDLHKTIKPGQFADLIAYLGTLKQAVGQDRFAGLPSEIVAIDKPIKLVPLHDEERKFDHPVWIIAVPGSDNAYLIVEQKTRKIWRFEEGDENKRTLFADFSDEASTGQFEGVMCLAFHPQFTKNRKYYVNYHVRNQGSHFSPVIVERRATEDLTRDAGVPSRRLLQIHQDTDLHWGGSLAFGPDGYLYIGAGDAGPQEDPEGNSQNLSLLTGSLLRIDVDRKEGDKPYAFPPDNPYRNAKPPIRPEIWASGYRMPWRFSWDSVTNDLWVGDIGQQLFEEVSIARLGENHGWNVYEGFMKFSDQYRRDGETYTPPIFSYRRKYGVSVTGGYVYRGQRNKSYYGAYIFSDFESKRIWALTQADRQLIKVRQIGTSPQKPASFGIDHDGELFLVGYEGTVYRVVLDDSVFE